MCVRSAGDWLVDMSYGAYVCRANQPFDAGVWGDRVAETNGFRIRSCFVFKYIGIFKWVYGS